MKKKRKVSEQKAIKWIIASAVFLVLIICVGVYELINDTDYRVSSKTSVLEKRQRNDTAEKKTVGWLRVQGTNIDFPVLYAPEYNFMYETEDFAWTEADYKELNNVVYISGHNIKNLSVKPLVRNKKHKRFEQLMSFAYYDFAKNNQFIQYTFNGKNYIYRIFAVACFDGSDLDVYNKSKYSEEKLNAFLEDLKESTIYKYKTDVNANDKLISLDTCTNFYGESNDTHFAVVGRLLRDNEKAKMVKVEKTLEYNNILEQMKGGDSNDEA